MTLFSEISQGFFFFLLLNVHPNRQVDYKYRFLQCGPRQNAPTLSANVYYQYKNEWHAPRRKHICTTLCARSLDTFLILLSTPFVQNHPNVLIKDPDSGRPAESLLDLRDGAFWFVARKRSHTQCCCVKEAKPIAQMYADNWLFVLHTEPSMGLLFAPDPLPVRHPASRISARSVEITYLLISPQFLAHFQTPSHFSCHGSKAKLRKMCRSSSCRQGATWCHSAASTCTYIFQTSERIGFKLDGNWLQRILKDNYICITTDKKKLW